MILLGDVVPLNLQVYDGKEDLTVKVFVIDQEQNLLFEGNLEHVLNGLYETRQFVMPEVEYVMATYIVFDGKTESKDYERANDLFFRDKEDAMSSAIKSLIDERLPSYSDYYTAKVISEKSDDFMEGRLNGTVET